MSLIISLLHSHFVSIAEALHACKALGNTDETQSETVMNLFVNASSRVGGCDLHSATHGSKDLRLFVKIDGIEGYFVIETSSGITSTWIPFSGPLPDKLIPD